MLGKYWIDKSEHGDKNSFFIMLDGMQLNSNEKEIFKFMQTAQFRYENIKLSLEERLKFSSLDKHLPNASEIVLEALTKCCVLTYVFVPICDILEGKYKDTLSYEQRYALWKGTGFKGVKAYAPYFIKESIYQLTPVSQDLLEKHQQMDIKDFSLEAVYQETMDDVVNNPQKISLWNSDDKKAIAFRDAVLNAYPDLNYPVDDTTKKICHSVPKVNFSSCRQKTL